MNRVTSRFKGKLLHVVTRRVTLPNAHSVTLEIVRHPGAVLIVPFLSKNAIILLRQLRPVVGKYLYELPAGTLQKKEYPRSCAQRELIEETGYAASRLSRMGLIYPSPGYSDEIIYLYKAEGLRKQKRRPEQDEIITVHKKTKSRIRMLIANNRISDAKTLCALALCGWA